MTYDIKELGFDTWIELYEYLKESNLQDEPQIALEWPLEMDVQEGEPSIATQRPEVLLDMHVIKSNAFDELYNILPLEASKQVAIAIAEDENSKQNRDIILEFINKIPSRK